MSDLPGAPSLRPRSSNQIKANKKSDEGRKAQETEANSPQQSPAASPRDRRSRGLTLRARGDDDQGSDSKRAHGVRGDSSSSSSSVWRDGGNGRAVHGSASGSGRGGGDASADAATASAANRDSGFAVSQEGASKRAGYARRSRTDPHNSFEDRTSESSRDLLAAVNARSRSHSARQTPRRSASAPIDLHRVGSPVAVPLTPTHTAISRSLGVELPSISPSRRTPTPSYAGGSSSPRVEDLSYISHGYAVVAAARRGPMASPEMMGAGQFKRSPSSGSGLDRVPGLDASISSAGPESSPPPTAAGLLPSPRDTPLRRDSSGVTTLVSGPGGEIFSRGSSTYSRGSSGDMDDGPIFTGGVDAALVAARAAEICADAEASLYAAARDGDADNIEALLEQGVPADGGPFGCGLGGVTPLLAAVSGGHVDATRRLLRGGATADAAEEDGSTPLMEACRLGHLEVAQLLLDADCSTSSQDEAGWSPLAWACMQGYASIVEALLAAGADAGAASKRGGSTPLHWGVDSGHIKVVEVILRHVTSASAPPDAARVLDAANTDTGATPLHISVRRRRKDIASLLLKHGATPDIGDKETRATPLHWAARYGRDDFVHMIVREGADVDAHDAEGRTPLFVAAEYGRAAALSELLDAGASVDARRISDGAMPVHVAAGTRRECLDTLLEHGADILSLDKDGAPPLMYAVLSSREECVHRLLEPAQGVEALAMRSRHSGQTAMDVAGARMGDGGDISVAESAIYALLDDVQRAEHIQPWRADVARITRRVAREEMRGRRHRGAASEGKGAETEPARVRTRKHVLAGLTDPAMRVVCDLIGCWGLSRNDYDAGGDSGSITGMPGTPSSGGFRPYAGSHTSAGSLGIYSP